MMDMDLFLILAKNASGLGVAIIVFCYLADTHKKATETNYMLDQVIDLLQPQAGKLTEHGVLQATPLEEAE